MTNDDAVRLDATLNVLADETRRKLLDRLAEDGQLSVDRISADLASTNGVQTTNPQVVTEREQIEASMRHVHLPKMDDAGVIDWYPETGLVTMGDHTQIAYDLLAVGNRAEASRLAHQKVSEQS